MAKKFGNDTLLWINNGGTFYLPSGQQTLTRSQSSSSIDIGDKNSAPYNLEAPTLISVVPAIDIWPDLPDVNGFERIFALSISQQPEIFQVRRNGIAGNGTTDVIFACSLYVMGCDATFPRNGVEGYSVKFGLAAVPTINRVRG